MQVDQATFNTRVAAVKAEIARCIVEAKRLYNVDLSVVRVSYDLRGQTGGWAGFPRHRLGETRQYYIKINRQFIAGEGFDHLVNETISHEFAHIICFMRPNLGHGHDAGWKKVHREMGGEGKRCHNVNTSINTGGYDYVTTTGKILTITKIRHRRILRGRSYTFKDRRVGSIDNTCQWKYRAPGKPAPTCAADMGLTYTAPVEPAKRTPVLMFSKSAPIWQQVGDIPRTKLEVALGHRVAPPVNTDVALQEVRSSGTSKAEQVRQMIRNAKLVGHSQEWVMGLAQSQLNMAKSQAYRYVTENWNRA